jgi:hypothetical protein
MASHLSSIGFHVETEEDFGRLVALAVEGGESFDAPAGSYVLWSPGKGVELWFQFNRDGEIVGLNPHFAGRALMHVALTQRVPRPEHSPLDGAFYGWADPHGGEDFERGQYPFVFDAPDFALHDDLNFPSGHEVQLAAFAHELDVYENDEAYRAAQSEDIMMAPESFIPSGLFSPEGGRAEQPKAFAIITGHVLETAIITNPATRLEFCAAKVRTLGGEVDVVADPETLNGFLAVGGVVSGSFWLSGRLKVVASRQ